MRLTNKSKGPRMILLTESESMVIMPGETKSVDASRILNGLPPGLVEEIARRPGKLAAPIAHDDDDEADLDPAPPELAKKATEDLPKLDGLNKQQLEAQAKAEGVDLDSIEGTGANGNVLVGDIKDAIQAARGDA